MATLRTQVAKLKTESNVKDRNSFIGEFRIVPGKSKKFWTILVDCKTNIISCYQFHLYFQTIHLSLLFSNESLGTRLHAQNFLQQRSLDLQNKLYCASRYSLLGQPSVPQEREMQLDSGSEVLHSAHLKHHFGWLWCRQILPRTLAGRNRKAVQFRWTRRVGHRRRNLDLNWISRHFRWKFAALNLKIKTNNFLNFSNYFYFLAFFACLDLKFDRLLFRWIKIA